MGCGGSRFNPENEAIPDKLRPLLRSRLDEIKKRKRSSNPTALSADHHQLGSDHGPAAKLDTELLPERIDKGNSDHEVDINELGRHQKVSQHYDHHHDPSLLKCVSLSRLDEEDQDNTSSSSPDFSFDEARKSVSAPEDITKEFEFQAIIPADDDHDDVDNINVGVINGTSITDHHHDDAQKDGRGAKKSVIINDGNQGKEDLDQYYNKNQPEEEERAGIIYCPASPSFRFYCRPLSSTAQSSCSSSDKELYEHGHAYSGKIAPLLQRQRSRVSEVESIASNDVPAKPLNKKSRKKIMKFRKVVIIAKTAYSARLLHKNLMKVRGCYTPLTSSSDNSRLLPKPPAA